MSELDVSGGETATPERGMQDIADDIETRLYGKEGGDEEEPNDTEDDEVSEDDESLPEDDDSDSEDDDGSDDSEDEASDADITLAGYLGIDEDKLIVKDDGTVVFNAIIDGKSQEVPLKDLAESFQMKGHVNNESIALQNDRKEFEETRTSVATQLKQRIEGIEALHKDAEEALVGEYNSIDWDRLRASDPSEWSALRQEYSEKALRIQRAQELVGQERKRINDEQAAEYETQMEAHMEGELVKLIGKNPTWSDSEVMGKDMGALKSFMTKTYGYDPKDLGSITDHRLIEVMKDAKSFRDGTKAAGLKKGKKVPKFQKPGAARGNAASLSKARAAKASRAALKKDGSTTSVAKAILDRM